MENELVAWRESTAGVHTGKGPRFNAEQRQAGQLLARRAIAAGMRHAEICRCMGISDQTLRDWAKRKRVLVPLQVVEAAEEPVRMFIGRMEAQLSVAQLAELARRLW